VQEPRRRCTVREAKIGNKSEERHLADFGLVVEGYRPGGDAPDVDDRSFMQHDLSREGQHVVHSQIGDRKCSVGEIVRQRSFIAGPADRDLAGSLPVDKVEKGDSKLEGTLRHSKFTDGVP
jgi:hypothetical protein